MLSENGQAQARINPINTTEGEMGLEMVFFFFFVCVCVNSPTNITSLSLVMGCSKVVFVPLLQPLPLAY